MSIKSSFIGELKNESISTKKILAKVPMDKAGWKPHEKSMTLGRLATHVAETNRWILRILSADEFDFAATPFIPHVASSVEELMNIYDEHLNEAIMALENANDTELEENWVVKKGNHVVYELKKKVAVRSWALNHTIHHRGQLSVYLRMLDVPVPGMYGPSADEK
ncbi:MAG: hypothetical protein JST47_15335 [Bacteroidetes bacterium]|nr:hypothetical protein [Bacteroidota bacterium]